MIDTKQSGLAAVRTAQPVAVRESGRLDSWKEIAAYLNRGTRTVQRWERDAGLPVHRLQHEKLGSVYAYRSELDGWWKSHGARVDDATLQQADRHTIAVLPFADMSEGQDQRYFCEGIAEEIIHRLAHVQALDVASRTSSFQFRSAGADTREIGKRLRVGAILEGSVRKSADLLRITVQLADAATGFQLWSGKYEREMSDVFAIQDEISCAVAQALEVTLSPKEADAIKTAPTASLKAYDLYLRGRRFYYQYGPRDMDHAVQLFMRAVEADPEFARAYAGLADCWSYIYLYSDRSQLVKDQADWASRKAVELNPLSAEAQASRGLSLSIGNSDGEAEDAFEAAIRLDPGLFEAHYFCARHCFARGRKEEAIQLYEAAMRVRPNDYQSPLLVAQSYEDLGRTEEARSVRQRGVELAERHLEVNPDDARALYMAANGLVALGQKDRGREYVERSVEMRPDDGMLLYNAGCIYAMLGDTDRALDCLDRAVQRGVTQRGWYEHDSNLDRVRGHSRFRALLEQLGE
jgi:adenylate cyclase